MDFRWNDWSIEHVAKHGVDPLEAQRVVERASGGYPLYRGDGKWLVWGRGRGGSVLQVVFLLDDDGTVFIIHARPLTDREKSIFRRNERK